MSDSTDDFEDIEGWSYVKRDLGEPVIVREDSEEVPEQDEPIDVVTPVRIFFASYFEQGDDMEDLFDSFDYSEEQIREAIEYSTHSTENMHEVARGAREMNDLFDEVDGKRIEKKLDLALAEDGDHEFVDYLDGQMADVEDLVEEQASRREFKIRYNPNEEQQYRSNMEMHVVINEDADEEVYIGVENEEVYVGSTVSPLEQSFSGIDEAEEVFMRELNELVYSESL